MVVLDLHYGYVYIHWYQQDYQVGLIATLMEDECGVISERGNCSPYLLDELVASSQSWTTTRG